MGGGGLNPPNPPLSLRHCCVQMCTWWPLTSITTKRPDVQIAEQVKNAQETLGYQKIIVPKIPPRGGLMPAPSLSRPPDYCASALHSLTNTVYNIITIIIKCTFIYNVAHYHYKIPNALHALCQYLANRKHLNEHLK